MEGKISKQMEAGIEPASEAENRRARQNGVANTLDNFNVTAEARAQAGVVITLAERLSNASDINAELTSLQGKEGITIFTRIPEKDNITIEQETRLAAD